MSPRRAIPLTLVAVAAVTATTAAAQPKEQTEDERTALALGNVVINALATGEAGMLASSMRAPLVSDVGLTGACAKKFKYGGRVARAKLAAYSRCLAGLAIDLRGRELVVLADAPGLVVAANSDDVNVRMKLRKVKKEWKVVEIGLQDLTEGDEGDGVEGCVIEGMVCGVVGGVVLPPLPPPPPPPPPQNITPVALETQRTSGSKNIYPETATKDAMVAAGVTKVTVVIKMCIDHSGAVASTKVLKTSGFPDYDTKLATTIKTWTYKPFMVNGAPTPVCSAIQYIYKPTP